MGHQMNLEFLSDTIKSAWQPPFRGEIYDYARKLNLQAGYAVKGEFDISTARHIIAPMQAIRRQAVLLVSVMAAIQALKSVIADISACYWAEHDRGDTLWLFEDDGKAKLMAKTRIVPLLMSVPEIAQELKGGQRFDQTTTAVKLPGQQLMIAGLNLGNVQSASWRRVIVDEGWMHGNDGLLNHAIDRTKQYPDTKKILLLGQGGTEDDDADREHKKTRQFELHYACPACGFFQPFELNRLRAEDFPIEKLRGTYAGLSWDTNEVTRPNGTWNYQEVGKTAHHRCYACDHRIEDTPAVRRQLNDSYTYFDTIGIPWDADTASGSIGFHWPAEASMRIPFRDLVVRYLRAKTDKAELGYQIPLQMFYQRDRGQPWAEDKESNSIAAIQESYDVNAEWPEQAYRTLLVDCQRDLQKFFFSVFAVAANSEARELERGQVVSFAEIADMQKKWLVKDQHVFLDCGYEMTKVLRECVQHGHVGTIKVAGSLRKIWLCWTGLKGSGRELFAHKHPKTGNTDWRIYSRRNFYNVNVGSSEHHPRAPWYEWSNLHCKDLLRARRDADPGVAKFLTLPDTLPTTDPNSYFAQMRSERRKEEWTPKGKRAIWELVKETRPNHYWDVAAMLMVFMAVAGIIGAPDAAEDSDKAES